MEIEMVLYGVLGLILAFAVFESGYRAGKLRGLKEAQASYSLRLAVLASGPKSALERLVASSPPPSTTGTPIAAREGDETRDSA